MVRIQQIGTGTELYDKPLSQFVAFFIGTPSINLFDAELKPEEDAIDLVTSSFTLRLPPEMHEKVQDYIGKRVNLGIRPEDLQSPKSAQFQSAKKTPSTAL